MKTMLPLLLMVIAVSITTQAQKPAKARNPIFVDKQGIMRWTRTGAEAAFFGVNYTVPFAYGYRSHKALGKNLEAAIDADVYHFARLGLNAFRVHVWDTEITDSLGNLLQNDHLRLYDYLLAKLSEYHIAVVVTPIAFWGNGYPEKDEPTAGFVSKYGKGPSVVKEEAFVAQENYLRQFFSHVNPYTGNTYAADGNIIAAEVNNEPHHSGPKARTTEYINRMAAAIRCTGFSKPVFYNISESPGYADAVAAANVQGFSFQWYPTGLVAGRSLQGNFLPNVDRYHIPFIDTIPAFANKARMVYEFDAGDVMQPIMYPAMARSFRAAGFQWATQFAWDPLATAYGNTEYQTHYLNLAYTPAKAISLMIAAKVFTQWPLGKQTPAYPADSTFGAFTVSYARQLSQMVTDSVFLYTGNTSSAPAKPAFLKQIAGVGSSPLVQYEGSGAYFLDKLHDGMWRLEVLPDAIPVADPFAKASPQKTVTHIVWNKHPMRISLPDLGDSIEVLNTWDENGLFEFKGSADKLLIKPGMYLVRKPGVLLKNQKMWLQEKKIFRYVAPPSTLQESLLLHQPVSEVHTGKPLTITCQWIPAPQAGKLTGYADTLRLELRHSAGGWKTIEMTRTQGYSYQAVVPVDYLQPGIVEYRVVVKGEQGFTTYPGGHPGNPYAWDYYHNQWWQLKVVPQGAPVILFEPATHRHKVNVYNTDWRNIQLQYITDNTGAVRMQVKADSQTKASLTGWQVFTGDILQQRAGALEHNTLQLELGSHTGTAAIIVSLVTQSGQVYSSAVTVQAGMQTISIPLQNFAPGKALLLPRPYPGFQPLMFAASNGQPLRVADVDKLELRWQPVQQGNPVSLHIGTIRWVKNPAPPAGKLFPPLWPLAHRG